MPRSVRQSHSGPVLNVPNTDEDVSNNNVLSSYHQQHDIMALGGNSTSDAMHVDSDVHGSLLDNSNFLDNSGLHLVSPLIDNEEGSEGGLHPHPWDKSANPLKNLLGRSPSSRDFRTQCSSDDPAFQDFAANIHKSSSSHNFLERSGQVGHLSLHAELEQAERQVGESSAGSSRCLREQLSMPDRKEVFRDASESLSTPESGSAKETTVLGHFKTKSVSNLLAHAHATAKHSVEAVVRKASSHADLRRAAFSSGRPCLSVEVPGVVSSAGQHPAPSGFDIMKKSSSSIDLGSIHFDNLEPVSVSDLYRRRQVNSPHGDATDITDAAGVRTPKNHLNTDSGNVAPNSSSPCGKLLYVSGLARSESSLPQLSNLNDYWSDTSSSCTTPRAHTPGTSPQWLTPSTTPMPSPRHSAFSCPGSPNPTYNINQTPDASPSQSPRRSFDNGTSSADHGSVLSFHFDNRGSSSRERRISETTEMTDSDADSSTTLPHCMSSDSSDASMEAQAETEDFGIPGSNSSDAGDYVNYGAGENLSDASVSGVGGPPCYAHDNENVECDGGEGCEDREFDCSEGGVIPGVLDYHQELADSQEEADSSPFPQDASYAHDSDVMSGAESEFASDSQPRSRATSVSFASLFKQCRVERDSHPVDLHMHGGSTQDGEDEELSEATEMVVTDVWDFLCAERVSQMTKTYNDIEAVTRLLEEKERDLELAARIGQTLLSKNKDLSSRTETLEEQLVNANDKVSQLRHDLSMKDELLRIYNEDLELENNGHTTPTNDSKGLSLPNVDFLQKKVHTLEDENLNLRLESAQLKADTDSYEEKEKKLVEDCIQQIAELNQQVESLAEELHAKAEENGHQKEEITGFLSQITDLQKKMRKLTLENMDLHEKLTASTESQRRLTKELGSMQDKYDELFEMLEEAQDELRVLRGRHKIRASGKHHHSAYAVPTDSLASELETSLKQELSQSNRRAQSWKIFETAKAAKRAAAKAAEKEVMSSVRMSVMAVPSSTRGDSDTMSQGLSAYPSDVESFASDGYSGDMDSLYGSNPELGRPGIPGSNDLESALKRLAIRRANELNEKDFQEEEEERRRQQQVMNMSGATSPNNITSPGSTYSYMSSNTGTPSGGQGGYKMSDKLQIVKPMEGSMTLRHWQHLATPHLGGIFEPREGVQMKGERKLELQEEVYSLSDFEEDDPRDVHTRKEQDSGLVYTFTDSTVPTMGPYRGLGSLFDNSRASSTTSLINASFTTDELPVQASTPKPVYKEQNNQQQQHQQASVQTVNSQGTSMSLGLASLLQGRENTGVGRAILRATSAGQKAAVAMEMSASPVIATQSVASGSVRNQSGFLMSQSLSNLSSSAPSSKSRNLPGSKSFEQVLQEPQEKVKVTVAVGEESKQASMFTPGMTGQGFLQQLKNKGYSLYGLWGGGGKGEGASSDPAAEGASGVDSKGLAAVEGNPAVTKPSAESVFANGSGGGGVGVLGALTNFRRNGIF
ncbi:uncharacterized protein LOC101863557 [Aplysia californica]|uniref:Uncharacterized protein LOC101863557 n=1 Tax=Aplysia californica TaxID=6500 RepID=A0ABM0K961_APLCA|nr:uncharacterized protein LOC101863557 [Aplysia californica]XP_035829203.1 uncharacterized protein LOC101863557 [Aplysia californica]